VRRGAKDVDLGDAYPLTRIGRIKTDRRGAVAVFDLVPVHDGGDEVFQPLALLASVGCGDSGSEDGGAQGSQRSPCLPNVERGDMTVADGFLAGGLGGDGFEGEGDFDEAAVVVIFH
jgi:hypothetical protein